MAFSASSTSLHHQMNLCKTMLHFREKIRRTRDKKMEGTQLIDFARLANFNLKRWILRISGTTSKFSMERKKGQ